MSYNRLLLDREETLMIPLSHKMLFFAPDYGDKIVPCFKINKFNSFGGTALKLECSFYNLNCNYNFFNMR